MSVTHPSDRQVCGRDGERERVAQARSIVAAMFALGAAAGLVGGAWATEAFCWQARYHTMIPVSGAILALSVALLPRPRVFLKEKLDIPGAVTLGLTLTFFLLALRMHVGVSCS